MKPRKFVTVILIIIILLTALFLYLFLTRNPLLWELPIFPKSQAKPVFLFSFGDMPGQGQLKQPMAAIVDGLGSIHVSDFERGEVVVYSPDGAFSYAYGKNAPEGVRFGSPYGMAEYNGRIHVADNAGRRILVFSQRGEYQRVLLESNAQSEIGIFIPTAMTVDPDSGTLYIADVFQQRILAVNQDGKLVASLPADGGKISLGYPNGLVLSKKKNLYVADSNNARIVVFPPDGQDVRIIEGNKEDEAELSVPRGIKVDDRENLWVADLLTHLVSYIPGDSVAFQFGGMGLEQGELYFPNDVLLHGNGNIYVVESGQGRISVFGNKVSATKR